MKVSHVKIVEFCKLVRGESPTLKTEPGPYPLVVTADFRRSASTYQIEGPAVCVPLISSTGHGHAAIHRVHYQEGRFALANLLVALLPDPAVCNAKYLYHLLMKGKDEYFVPLMLGTANVSLKEQDIGGVEVPLPPIREQRRIVARIEELAAKVELASLFATESREKSARLIPGWLSSNSSRQSQSYQKTTIGEVIDTLDAGWSPQCERFPAKEGQWGVLKTTSVQWLRFDPAENKELPSTLSPKQTLAVSAGDVLVTRAGPRKRVGVVACVKKSESKLTISDKILRLRPKTDLITPRFLELAIASPAAQEYLVRRKTGLADAQVNISQNILRGTPVIVPPIHEQNRIVEEFDRFQSTVRQLQAIQLDASAQLDALLPAILNHAFKGEL